MITSKEQYNITKEHLVNFTKYLKELSKLERKPTIHPILHKAQVDALQSQIDVFTDDIMKWEKSKVYTDDEARSMALTCVMAALQPVMISIEQERDFYETWEKLTKL